MNKAEIASRFAHIEREQQEMTRWEKQLRGVETAVRQLEATHQHWLNQITWRDGLNLTLTELYQHQQQLEEDERLWVLSRRPQQPETALAECKTAVRQTKSRIHDLQAQELTLQQLEELWSRWQQAASKQRLARQITILETQWEAEQQQEASLLVAYEQLQVIIAELQTHKERYATIERMIQELDQAIAGDQKETWLALAFTNINALSQDIGDRLRAIEESSQASQSRSEALQKEAAKANQALEPDRQHVAALQAEEKALRESFANLPQELYQWAQESRRLKMPTYLQVAKVDGESEEELENLLQRMQPELHHLQWFKEQVASL
jgi:hypothetical protein